jgi:hypothetical protein
MRFGTRLVQGLSQFHCRLAEIVGTIIARCQVARRSPKTPPPPKGSNLPFCTAIILAAVIIYESDQQAPACLDGRHGVNAVDLITATVTMTD